MDKRITPAPVVQHQTGVEILKHHVFILCETIAVHRSGMTPAAIEGINQEIKDLERLVKYEEKK